MPSYQNRKDKAVSQLSYLYNGNPFTLKYRLYIETGPSLSKLQFSPMYSMKDSMYLNVLAMTTDSTWWTPLMYTDPYNVPPHSDHAIANLGPISWTIFPSQFTFLWKLHTAVTKVIINIHYKICKLHHSCCAFMACAKFCSDLIPTMKLH